MASLKPGLSKSLSSDPPHKVVGRNQELTNAVHIVGATGTHRGSTSKTMYKACQQAIISSSCQSKSLFFVRHGVP